ncbi:MAG TPA: molybdate ABC transporter substrate-binding protein, partial [Methylophilaceae bacterium]|nr:molybdate ABC transporter substrate-binding protein [Methylophilaceae bacterium]
VVPKGHGFPVRFEPGFDFAKALNGHLCTGEPESVPVGIYAKQSLMQLGWWQHLKNRIVGTPDVRGALAFVERGECAAGIVYESDARITDKVEIAGVFPEESHAPIVYPMAFVAGARNMDQGYWTYLQSPAAEVIFAKYGFRILK